MTNMVYTEKHPIFQLNLTKQEFVRFIKGCEKKVDLRMKEYEELVSYNDITGRIDWKVDLQNESHESLEKLYTLLTGKTVKVYNGQFND